MKIIDRFEEAVRKDEMKGGGRPEEIPEIEEEYRKSKHALVRYLLLLKRKSLGRRMRKG